MDVGCLPTGVDAGFVQEVVAEVGPGLVRILGNVDHCRAARGCHEKAGRAVGRALLVVVVAEARHMCGGEERQAEAGRPASCDFARPTEHQHRMRIAGRRRGDLHGGAAELERLACPRVQHRCDRLIHLRSASGPILTVRGVLLGSVSDAGDGHKASAAGEVQGGDVLGNAQWIVQRHEQGRDGDLEVLRRSEDQPGEDQRR